ncbi:MAG: hypothetical protein BZY88_06225 [SAR202 cluster bacterium Io17-Chloro-G9]|nr:MAG: hypothetical protein BZY88_06225 [SAR202 cluster bacterium Io17-Chloro-G9]
MIDTVRINLNGGDGGNGCVSFLREKYRSHGGPNGGDGGDGGDIYLCGDQSLNTLLHLKFNSTTYAPRGSHGKGKNQRGGDGADVVIKVPVGTEVSVMSRDGSKAFIADITDESLTVMAEGGRGGWGNSRYVSPTNQEPVLAQRGERGEKVVLFLELKLLADVGLLARPNAGKSTLISRCSAAKPRVAEYPFTTVEPVLGVVNSYNETFVMMEVPGLLEGAHEGIGLGHEFLRHAERARLYVHLLDGLSEDPVADWRMLNTELRQFNAALAERPQIVVVNKLDVTEVKERQETIRTDLETAIAEDSPAGLAEVKDSVLFISAVSGEGVDTMLGRVVELLRTLPKELPDMPERNVQPRAPHRPRSRWSVRREDGVFVVDSEELERMVALADTRDPRVLLQVWREMSKRGMAQEMAESGIQPGDTIRIGKVEVEWF